MQQNPSCQKHDLEPGSTQGAQAGAKGDQARDEDGEEVALCGQGSMQEKRAEFPSGHSARQALL